MPGPQGLSYMLSPMQGDSHLLNTLLSSLMKCLFNKYTKRCLTSYSPGKPQATTKYPPVSKILIMQVLARSNWDSHPLSRECKLAQPLWIMAVPINTKIQIYPTIQHVQSQEYIQQNVDIYIQSPRGVFKNVHSSPICNRPNWKNIKFSLTSEC